MEKQRLKFEKMKTLLLFPQLLMILAGFLLATGGIAFTNSQNNIETSMNINYKRLTLINFMIEKQSDIVELNATQQCIDLVDAYQASSISFSDLSEANQNLSTSCFIFGLALSTFSIFLFIVGEIFILNMKEK